MITEEEKDEIINLAVEKAMLMLPETVGHLITTHMANVKLNRDFYGQHPELRDKKDIVASVIEMVEGENPFDPYEKLLEKAMPRIKERIGVVEALDTKTVSPSLNRDFKQLDMAGSPNGEL